MNGFERDWRNLGILEKKKEVSSSRTYNFGCANELDLTPLLETERKNAEI